MAVCGALGDWGELLPPTPGFLELVEVRDGVLASFLLVCWLMLHKVCNFSFGVSWLLRLLSCGGVLLYPLSRAAVVSKHPKGLLMLVCSCWWDVLV